MSYQPGPGGPPWNPPGTTDRTPQWQAGPPLGHGPGPETHQPWNGPHTPQQWSMPPGPQTLPPFNVPPPVPPRKTWGKWVVIATVVIVVIAAVVVAITVTNGGSSSEPEAVPAAPSDVASAGDKGPATIVLDDITCEAQRPIFQNFYEGIKASGYEDLDHSVPKSRWSPEERRIYGEAERITASVITQVRPLAKLTPHRVMRELYEQATAYWQAWIDRLPNYAGTADDEVRATGTVTEKSLVNICTAIQYKSAQARSFLADPPSSPTDFAAIPSDAPQPFLGSEVEQCSEYTTALKDYDDDPVIKEWRGIDYKIAASAWDSHQRQLNDQAATLITELTHKLEDLASSSGNPVMADFTALGAQYLTAYAKAIPSYTSNDDSLIASGMNLLRIVGHACKAAAG